MTDPESFGLGELMCDPYFQDWILHPDPESDAFWNRWRTAQPGREALITEASVLLRSLRFTEDFPTEDQTQQALRRTLEHLQVRRPLLAWRIAAVLAGVALCTGLYYYLHRQTPMEKTTATLYGETRTLYLPDSSKVVLNAHSSVHYTWAAGKSRDIWLEGEAYFDVRPLARSAFVVHSGGLDVEVLGTTFDVRNRRGKVAVVLETGRVRVQRRQTTLVMTPGDKVVYDSARAVITRTVTKAQNDVAWKDKRLVDVTMEDVAEYIEDNYDKVVILKDPAMGKRRIGGVVMLDNLDDALFALSTLLKADIIRHGDTLIVQPR